MIECHSDYLKKEDPYRRGAMVTFIELRGRRKDTIVSIGTKS